MPSDGATLDLKLLSGFEAVCAGAPVARLDSLRLQALLTFLALHRAAPQPRSQLAFAFWPDSSEGQAHANLRSLLLRLQRSLPASLTLLDVDLLPACYDEWIVPQRERLHRLCLDAGEQLLALNEQARDWPAALRALDRLLELEPLREDLYRSAMRLHALAGEPSAAEQLYRRCARTLERELGVEPARATQKLRERLLRAGPSEVPRERSAELIGRAAEYASRLIRYNLLRQVVSYQRQFQSTRERRTPARPAAAMCSAIISPVCSVFPAVP